MAPIIHDRPRTPAAAGAVRVRPECIFDLDAAPPAAATPALAVQDYLRGYALVRRRPGIERVGTIALLWVLLLGVMAMLGGCASAQARPEPSPAPPQAAPTPASAGSIYSDGGGMALFEDRKARNVGDIVTILLVETTTAKSTAATSTSKETNSNLGAPTVFGAPVTVNGVPVLSGALDSKHSFSGSGDSAQSNTLSGSLSAVIVGRLPNGNLLVRGEKQLQLNQGSEYVRIEGVVRPADIAPDNTIPSSRVADARIAYAGKGTLAESNSKGWLARFFSSPWMPF